MKRIFIMADSIGGHYFPYLQQFLSGKFEMSCRQDIEAAFRDLAPCCNASANSRIVRELYRRKEFRPDGILLNCGLHDIKVDAEGHHEVEREEYGIQLSAMVEFLKPRTRLIWVRTTPVNERCHNRPGATFRRFNQDVEDYNRIADGIMIGAGIPEIDLYSFSLPFDAESAGGARIDHVHYKETIRRMQAAFLAGWLECFFDEPEASEKTPA